MRSDNLVHSSHRKAGVKNLVPFSCFCFDFFLSFSFCCCSNSILGGTGSIIWIKDQFNLTMRMHDVAWENGQKRPTWFVFHSTHPFKEEIRMGVCNHPSSILFLFH
jgi:hypothetical protein